jgi:hypothetical protein
MKNQFNPLPYDLRNMEQAGLEHGSGLPSTIGKKKGGFSDNAPKASALPKGKPPRKMN